MPAVNNSDYKPSTLIRALPMLALTAGLIGGIMWRVEFWKVRTSDSLLIPDFWVNHVAMTFDSSTVAELANQPWPLELLNQAKQFEIKTAVKFGTPFIPLAASMGVDAYHQTEGKSIRKDAKKALKSMMEDGMTRLRRMSAGRVAFFAGTFLAVALIPYYRDHVPFRYGALNDKGVYIRLFNASGHMAVLGALSTWRGAAIDEATHTKTRQASELAMWMGTFLSVVDGIFIANTVTTYHSIAEMGIGAVWAIGMISVGVAAERGVGALQRAVQ